MTPATTTADMVEILPCPFCGAPAHAEFQEKPFGLWLVHAACGPDCQIQPSAKSDTKSDAIAAWNRRHQGETST